MNKDKIILENIFANAALENNPLTEQEKQRLEKLYNGEITFDQFKSMVLEDINLTDDEKIDIAAKKVLQTHRKAFEELASTKETLYLNSIPGMTESIIAGGQTSIEECLSESELKDIENGIGLSRGFTSIEELRKDLEE